MLRKPWLLNLVLLAAIAAVGLRLFALWRSAPAALPEAPVAAREGEAGGAAAPGAGEEEAERDYAVIAARDLFSQSRGAAPPPAPAAAGVPAPPAAPKPPPKISLFGVVILDGAKTAFLTEGAGDVKPRKVREGESFAGGTLRTIRPDGVTIAFPSGEVTVGLRSPKEGLPAGPMPPQVPTLPGAQPARALPVQRPVPTAVQRRVGAGEAIAVPGAAAVPRFTPAPLGEEDDEEDLYEEDLDDEDFEEDEEYLDEDEEFDEEDE